MKTQKIKCLSIVMSLLLLFNSLGMFASDAVMQDESIGASLTESVANSSYPPEYLKSRMGKYYSDYNDALPYINTIWVSQYGYLVEDDGLMLRSNCYGYAFRMFYSPETFPVLTPQNFPNIDQEYQTDRYKQTPGEFAIKSATDPLIVLLSDTQYYAVSNYKTLQECWNKITGDIETTNEWRMRAMVQLLNADAATLGYTLTEYTGDTIPDAMTNRNQRLIAVAINENDYHFYMQHSDNTWSHKRGEWMPEDYCISHETVLTNDNIRDHACEGTYTNAELKFFYITKSAITDFNHRNGTSSNRTVAYTNGVIGNHCYAAEDIGELPEDYLSGKIDYPGDVDYYSIFTSDDETRTMGITSDSGYNIKISVYYGSTLVASQTTTTTATFTVDFEVDSTYYISVEALDFDTYEFGVTYTFW